MRQEAQRPAPTLDEPLDGVRRSDHSGVVASLAVACVDPPSLFRRVRGV
jgi:hypothetical protein